TVSGSIGSAQNFDDAGNQDFIRLDAVSDASWTAVTVQVLINPDDAGDDRIFGKSWGTGSADQTWLLRQTSGAIGSRMRSDSNNNGGCDGGALTTGTWYWVAVTWDASDDTVRVFRNGTQQTSCGLVGNTLYTTPTVSQPTIGNTTTEDRGFDGQLQEARVSKVARSADWMTTEFNNMSNRGTGSGAFIQTLGAEEALMLSLSGPSNLANGTSVRWAQNALLRSHSTTVVNGSFNLSVDGTISAGDVITIWADGVAEANEATVVTKAHASEANMSGLMLHTGTLHMGHTEGTFTINMTDLGQYDNNDDEDIIYLLTAGTTLQSVHSSMGMRIVNGTFVTNGYEMEIKGTLDIDGALNASSGAGGESFVYVRGPWDVTGGVFTNTNSTVVFTGTSSGTYSYDIISDGKAFNNVIINDGLVGYWRLDET
ncbi:MAG: LamG domain-containing protein, partial [Candidatus Omnitrophica bacterium]|nr:LamG domain-containing protein [Candidatus Omnitrophota bacterium]